MAELVEGKQVWPVGQVTPEQGSAQETPVAVARQSWLFWHSPAWPQRQEPVVGSQRVLGGQSLLRQVLLVIQPSWGSQTNPAGQKEFEPPAVEEQGVTQTPLTQLLPAAQGEEQVVGQGGKEQSERACTTEPSGQLRTVARQAAVQV